MTPATSEYTRRPDGSGVITETFPDGSQRVVVLPPPFVVDAGPCYTTTADNEVIQRREDRITRLDAGRR